MPRTRRGELHKCCSADDDNMVRAAGDGKFGNDATLGLIVGRYVVAGLEQWMSRWTIGTGILVMAGCQSGDAMG